MRIVKSLAELGIFIVLRLSNAGFLQTIGETVKPLVRLFAYLLSKLTANVEGISNLFIFLHKITGIIAAQTFGAAAVASFSATIIFFVIKTVRTKKNKKEAIERLCKKILNPEQLLRA